MNNFSLVGRLISCEKLQSSNGTKFQKVVLEIPKNNKENENDQFEISLWGPLAEEDIMTNILIGIKGHITASKASKDDKSYWFYSFVGEKIYFL